MIRRASVLSLVSLIAANGVADESPHCEILKQNLPDSVHSMVNNAQYVGLYLALNVKPIKSLKTVNDVEVFEVELLRQWELKIGGPLRLFVSALEPPEVVPPEYYSISRKHELMIGQEIQKLGSTYASALPEQENCSFLPVLIPGYNYLVFGDLESPASFEFIPDVRIDMWYL